ncbi:N-acetylglucosamine-6-phosphate deacetylase [Mucilaginibacter ginsenosidivorax]|uniref:N-acetylglucosamine-6-phosphate deacetylase n=1 Tax=Mucilaginibacter ginsenosidivorax TaxID=862126 RepID=A0A5B8WDI7_9SPHI|nr:N-acetylglucosamine-6-phosphate deacetylase [Mucilaginibacter ginsenosidivorax]QEC79978.1 N-acetylglucosamine-6-phosphate deacetylase [Mucilaginibacter ginsenosidivorax]
MNKQLKITNGRIITPQCIINGTILISQTKITAISQRDIDAPDALVIDAHGNYVSPGFIDIHVHGGGGHDFMDGNEEAFLEIARTHARYGTTAMVPTTLTAEKADLLKTLDLYASADVKNTMGAQFLGMHLEGPYFAMNQRGAQDPRYIRNPDEEEYKEIIAYSKAIKRWSAAPELPGAIKFAKYLQANGIMPALAHTDAIYEEVAVAFENGYTLATHLYSGMSGVSRRNAYRYAGVIEAAFLIDAMDVEVIADGIHLPAPLLKLVYKIKGPDRVALITDAMRAAGMPEGDSVLGNKDTGLKVIVEDGVAKLPDRSSFAGSVATCDRLVRTMMEMADVPLHEAIKMMTKNPATIMGVDDRKGTLVEGLDADIAIFDEQINIQATIVNGKLVFGG